MENYIGAPKVSNINLDTILDVSLLLPLQLLLFQLDKMFQNMPLGLNLFASFFAFTFCLIFCIRLWLGKAFLQNWRGNLILMALYVFIPLLSKGDHDQYDNRAKSNITIAMLELWMICLATKIILFIRCTNIIFADWRILMKNI